MRALTNGNSISHENFQLTKNKMVFKFDLY